MKLDPPIMQVRRELGGALQDVASLIGPARLLQYLTSLVAATLQQFQAQRAPAQGHDAPHGDSPGGGHHAQLGWERLECVLFAATVGVGW